MTAALAGLIYTPNEHFNGTDTFTITLNDGGNQGGDDSPALVLSVLTINVQAINDQPLLILPGTQIVNEDVEITFSVDTDNAVSVVDVDALETDPGNIQLIA